MQILLDECVPRPLKRQLTQYRVSNRLPDLIPQVCEGLETIVPGQVVEI